MNIEKLSVRTRVTYRTSMPENDVPTFVFDQDGHTYADNYKIEQEVRQAYNLGIDWALMEHYEVYPDPISKTLLSYHNFVFEKEEHEN